MTERVQFNEINNTKKVPIKALQKSAAYVGTFNIGQAFKPILINDETELVENFGEPVSSGTNENLTDFYICLDYLKKSRPLLIMRLISLSDPRNSTLMLGTAGVNAGDASNYVKRINDDINPVVYNGDAFVFESIIYAAYPSTYGNNIKIAISDTGSDSTGFGVTFTQAFNGRTLGANEVYIVIGMGSSTILEKFIVSENKYAKDEFGNSTFIDDVLINKSKYVRAYSSPNASGIIDIHSNTFSATALAGGNASPADQTTELTNIKNYGLDKFANKEAYDIVVLIDNHNNITNMKGKMIDLVATRGDSVYLIAPPISEALLYEKIHANADIKSYYDSWIAAIDAASTSDFSYAGSFINFKMVKCKYNDVVFINSMIGDVAGEIVSRLDKNGFYQPVAGLSNGEVITDDKVIKSWTEDDRKVFAEDRINPVIVMKKYSDYPIIYDWITMLNENSILNKLNARFTVNFIKKYSRIKAGEILVFDKNSTKNADSFKNKMIVYLDSIKNNNGLKDYRILETTTNSERDDDTSSWLIGLKIPGIIREILIQINVVGQSVNLDEKLAI